MKRFCLLLLVIFLYESIFSQNADSGNKIRTARDTIQDTLRPVIKKKDTLIPENDSDVTRIDTIKPGFQKPALITRADTMSQIVDTPRTNQADSVFQDSLNQLLIKEIQKPVIEKRLPVLSEQIPKISENKNWLFYYLVGILIFLGLLKQVHNTYFRDLFRYFFRTSLNQSQIQEKLIQSELPSFLLNIFFIVVAGTFLFLLKPFAGTRFEFQSWQVLLICIGGVGVLYLLKFFLLRSMGWIFGLERSAGTYVFTVFMVNKVLGIALTPFLIILAFTAGNFYEAGLTVAIILIILLFLYRFFRSYSPVKQDISLNRFHFFIYLCAFEVVPLLLIYKTLLLVF